MNEFTESFLVCALWSSTDNADESGGEPLDKNYEIEDFAPETLAKLEADCEAFQAEMARELELTGGSEEQSGHDFWLTRNGHGAGFWDRGYPRVLSDRLTEASHVYGSVDLYVGDDGKIHC